MTSILIRDGKGDTDTKERSCEERSRYLDLAATNQGTPRITRIWGKQGMFSTRAFRERVAMPTP